MLPIAAVVGFVVTIVTEDSVGVVNGVVVIVLSVVTGAVVAVVVNGAVGVLFDSVVTVAAAVVETKETKCIWCLRHTCNI